MHLCHHKVTSAKPNTKYTLAFALALALRLNVVLNRLHHCTAKAHYP